MLSMLYPLTPLYAAPFALAGVCVVCGVNGPAVFGLIWDDMAVAPVAVLILRDGVVYKGLPANPLDAGELL